jgi:hypothetical protein
MVTRAATLLTTGDVLTAQIIAVSAMTPGGGSGTVCVTPWPWVQSFHAASGSNGVLESPRENPASASVFPDAASMEPSSALTDSVDEP